MKILTTSLIFMLCTVMCWANPIYTLNEQWVSCGKGVKLLDPYYSDGVTFTWDGPSKNGKAHGTGTAVKYMNGAYVINRHLMSLWKVDNTATQLLMTDFYRNYLSGKSKQESLRLVQQPLRNSVEYSAPPVLGSVHIVGRG